MRAGTKLDKNYIINKITGNEAYGDYVPDNYNPTKLSKEFLLTLVSYADQSLYHDFYNTCNEEN